MSPLQLANRYMNILFDEGELDDLLELFADEFQFSGPFYEFSSGRTYVDALKAGPPRDFSYETIGAWEDDTSACIMYQFQKPGISVTMSQFFEIDNDRICRILLVFDTAPFIQSTLQS